MSLPKFQTNRARALWVQSALKLKGTSMAQLAADAGVKRQAVYRAMFSPSLRMETAIATALGVTVQMLFPERYDADTGERLHHVRQDRQVNRDRNGDCRGVA